VEKPKNSKLEINKQLTLTNDLKKQQFTFEKLIKENAMLEDFKSKTLEPWENQIKLKQEDKN